MSIRAFLFAAAALAVAALSLSALFQPAFVDPLIEQINAPIVAQLEAEPTDLSEGSGSDCVDCGVDPGPAHDPDEGVVPGPGVSVEVDPASDADGFVGTIWEDGGRKVVVYTPGDKERAVQLAQGVYYEVGYLTLRPWEWTDRA